ncbi:RCC1 domain-containing protein [Rhabdothermincola sp.]|uniref:RCC1 domain-containing protein n=1 Tax=Rhabdothermincola sp. TaxID=2820405 RepID=UPI002FE11125
MSDHRGAQSRPDRVAGPVGMRGRPARSVVLVGVMAVLTAAAVVFGAGPAVASPPATVSMGSVVVPAPMRNTTVKVPITLSRPQASDVYVSWQVSGGSLGVDYAAPKGTKTTRIPAGRTRGFASVKLYGMYSGRYFFPPPLTITITGVSGAPVGVGTPSGVLEVRAEDKPPAAISIGSVSVFEGDHAKPQTVSVPIVFTEFWDYPPGTEVQVTWQVTPVSATPGVDYKAPTMPKTTTIKSGYRGFATVAVLGDVAQEGDEVFEVTILSATAVPTPPPPPGCEHCHPEDITILNGTGTVTILDDDAGTANLKAWGFNGFGSLGLGDTTDRYVPAPVGTNPDWQRISVGQGSVLAIDGDGSLWGWGHNWMGQLGTGDTDNRLTPTQVGSDTDWVAVDQSSLHVLALKSDGSLWAWGANGRGQLGTGDTDDRLTPTQVGTDTDWVAVSAGAGFSLALKADGSLWSWGENSFGQLGLGDLDDRSVPTRVGLDEGWVDISASPNGSHAFARKPDGTLWAWGYNEDGELGLGDSAPHLEPTPLGSESDWADVEASDSGGFALKADGTLWAWGANNFVGQLGVGDTSGRGVPTQVGTDTDWVTVAPGASHTLALKADGTLWVWGGNYVGQLGLGDFENRLSPTMAGSATWQAVAAGDGFSLGLSS